MASLRMVVQLLLIGYVLNGFCASKISILVLAVALTMVAALSSQSHFGGLSASLEQPYFYPECFLLCDWTGNRGHSSSYALVRTAVLYPLLGVMGNALNGIPVSTALWKTWQPAAPD